MQFSIIKLKLNQIIHKFEDNFFVCYTQNNKITCLLS